MPSTILNKRILGILFLAACVSCDRLSGFVRSESGNWSAGDASHTVDVNGLTRSFIVHTPSAPRRSRFGAARRYPLIVVLHGSGASGDDIQSMAGFDSIADVRHFLVAYPDAAHGAFGFTSSDWNAGTCCGLAKVQQVDDVTFILKVIDRISLWAPVDPRRVYVSGFSDGGRMAFRLACAAPERIAAIAVVAGSLRQPACAPQTPVALIAFHGTADSSVPYSEPADTHSPNAADTAAQLTPSVETWAFLNGCTDIRSSMVSVHVNRLSFAHCDGSETVLYSIGGGGHAWPTHHLTESRDQPEFEIAATPIIVSFLLSNARR